MLPKLPLVFWFFRVFICIMTFLLVGVTLNITQVLSLVLIFLRYFSGIDSSGWMISLPTFLAFLGVRSLGLRLISRRRRVVGLCLFFIIIKSLIVLLSAGIVFVFLNQQLIYFWAPGIDLSSPGRLLKAYFCCCIDSFFYYFILDILVFSLIVQLCSNKWI